jgi:hypothetical protein
LCIKILVSRDLHLFSSCKVWIVTTAGWWLGTFIHHFAGYSNIGSQIVLGTFKCYTFMIHTSQKTKIRLESVLVSFKCARLVMRHIKMTDTAEHFRC